MKIDFHCHAIISRKLPFRPKYLEALLRTAAKSGLDAIAITEHIHLKDFIKVYDYLDSHFSYVQDHYVAGKLKIFPGAEVDITESRAQVIVLGKREAMRNLCGTLMQREYPPTLPQLLTLLERKEHILIGAHPFREKRPLKDVSPELVVQLDAVELNGKDMHSANAFYTYADSLQMPIVAGSDSHHYFQVGCVYNQFYQDCSTIGELSQCIADKRYEIHIHPHITYKLWTARQAKKVLKRYYAIMQSFNHHNEP